MLKWTQEPTVVARMLALVGASVAELDNLPAWHGFFAKAHNDVLLLPLACGWKACAIRGAVNWSLVAVIPAGAFEMPCVANRDFFAKQFPATWITAARASTKNFNPLKPIIDIPTVHRPGFPCFVSFMHVREVAPGIVQTVNTDGTVATVLLDPSGDVRSAADVDGKRWYPVYRNVLGSARLFSKGPRVINNIRWAFTMAGKQQASLRHAGLAIDDDVVTAADVARFALPVE